MRRTILLSLILPLLLASGASQAQRAKTKPGPQEMSSQANSVREACAAKAQVERPQINSDEFRATFNPRYNIYAACVKGKGYRP